MTISRRGSLFWFLFFFLFIGISLVSWLLMTRPVDPAGREAQIVVINRGESLDGVARKLKSEGLIRSAFGFKLWMMMRGQTTQVQAGSFRLAYGLSFSQLNQALAVGTIDVWVTFPEGWRAEQYALRLEKEGFELDREVWADLTKSEEGYLFPDTYLVPKGATETQIIELLTATFEERVAGQLRQQAVERGLAWGEVVIIASMVEREVRQEVDLPIVAGIIVKRWRSGWPLQIDATVQYALSSQRCRSRWEECDWWPNNLTKTDLGLQTSYNTYLSPGLPPAPISNPGLEALRAVVEYQETPYWFYLSDAQGTTHYGETLADHNANIAQYLRK